MSSVSSIPVELRVAVQSLVQQVHRPPPHRPLPPPPPPRSPVFQQHGRLPFAQSQLQPSQIDALVLRACDILPGILGETLRFLLLRDDV
jgi:hypothetical protein